MSLASPIEPAPHTHRIAEASGQSFSPREAVGLIAVGCNSLLVLGVLPILLGALADAGRLSNAEIGLSAMVELLAMGASTGLMGLIKRPRGLKLIGTLASVAIALADLASMGGAHGPLVALRGLAGAFEGILLWITVGMIARTATPERWAGVFFTAQTAAQLVLALILANLVLPRFGANGAFLALAVSAVLGVAAAMLAPPGFDPLVARPEEAGAPPLRGMVALLASLIFVAGGGAIGVYLEPLAHEAGLGAGVAGAALWTSLIGQVIGGALATVLAGRIRYFWVFVIGSALSLGVWALLGTNLPAWAFIADNAASGIIAMTLAPFVAPMTIEADPSRRAAMQTGAAQLLGGALGPLLSSFVVTGAEVRQVLWLGAALLLAGLTIIAGLHLTHRPQGSNDGLSG
ncbi:MAG: MFS transporter [Alphaproteobacteria bacterium]|nr:MFS transporter [Alphaproteobacteria bacterium]